MAENAAISAPVLFFDKPEFFTEKIDERHKVKIIGLQRGNKRTSRYVNGEILRDPAIDKWKVFVPESNGSGAIGAVDSTPLIGEPLIGEPGVGCTESFVQVGPFSTENEAQNCMKYIKSKFCRTLLGTLKITQHNPKSTWKNVPVQDFTGKSDVNWSRPVSDIDQQLYTKYKLSKEEVDFIESHVKAME